MPQIPELGFGNLYTVASAADIAALRAAEIVQEADGQETCSEPIVVCGGSLTALEACAALLAASAFSSAGRSSYACRSWSRWIMRSDLVGLENCWFILANDATTYCR